MHTTIKNKILQSVLLTILSLPVFSQKNNQDSLIKTLDDRCVVCLETSFGNIKIALYNETPKHRDNFLKLVKEGFYNGVLFHRVIPEFMVQTGDPSSKSAVPGQLLGNVSLDYTIPAEIRFPQYYHKRGAVAAAQEDNSQDHASSSCQFYIVTGKTFGPRMLDAMLNKLTEKSGGTIVFNDKIKNDYQTIGGAPHLDGLYTVFGEVVDGMDVVNKIQDVEKDQNNRPINDIKIIKANVVKDLPIMRSPNTQKNNEHNKTGIKNKVSTLKR